MLKQSFVILILFGLISIAYFTLVSPTNAGLLALEPSVKILTGTALLTETFDSSDAWESYSSPTGIQIGVENGVYRASSFVGGFVWGLNQLEHEDVVIEVQTTQMSPFTDNAFGVMCRADTRNNGDGYYFMINGKGYYSIRIGDGDRVLPLVDWGQSSAIHDGIDSNTIRAVCLDEYLALYANGELVAETTDDTFASGFAGLTIAAAESGSADIAFDNLNIWEALAG